MGTFAAIRNEAQLLSGIRQRKSEIKRKFLWWLMHDCRDNPGSHTTLCYWLETSSPGTWPIVWASVSTSKRTPTLTLTMSMSKSEIKKKLKMKITGVRWPSWLLWLSPTMGYCFTDCSAVTREWTKRLRTRWDWLSGQQSGLRGALHPHTRGF